MSNLSRSSGAVRSAVPPPDKVTLDRESLFMEFAPLVRRLIRQYGRDMEMRQDLVGEIYWRFYALLDVYDPGRGVPLHPYLVRQLSASIYTYARRQWRLRQRESGWDIAQAKLAALTVPDPTSSWIWELSQQSLAATLPAALAKLSVRQRQVVIWRYYEARSFEEIARLLGRQEATARSLLRHAIHNMRKWIHQDGKALHDQAVLCAASV